MRYQGKVTNWNDVQGYGFVTPNGGGQKAFVHIKAFSNSSHRPIDGVLITYELMTDEKGRFSAKNIRFVADSTSSNRLNNSNLLVNSFAISFCILVALLAIFGILPLVIISLYLVASVLTFLLYVIDKSAAQNNHWRIKENKLHLLSLIGGWPGALLAQKMIRHKSKKEEFQKVFWTTVFVNCITLVWLLTTTRGSNFLNSIVGQFA